MNDYGKKIVEAIDAGYAGQNETPRAYIGASVIGHTCDAYLAFCLRGFAEGKFPPRVKRIFKLGHKLETQVVEDLKKHSGLQVYELDGLTGRQHAYSMFGTHVRCHADGQVEDPDGTLRLLEVKSMNDKSFEEFRERGVKSSHPRYYAQMMMLMALSSIPTCLFIAYNKNTSEYWAQLVEFDEFEWHYLRHRIDIVMTNQARRVASDRADWRCKQCSREEICWRGGTTPASCATCQFAAATRLGGWWCLKHDRDATGLCGLYEQYAPLPKE